MSKKDIIQICITGVLIIVLGILTYRTFGGKVKGKGKSNADSLVFLSEISYDQIIGEEVEERKGLYARLEEETWNLYPPRSPFSKQHMDSVSGPYLNGIYWGNTNPTAIINGEIVENGSRINKYTVIEIKKDVVILMEDDTRKEYRLELFK